MSEVRSASSGKRCGVWVIERASRRYFPKRKRWGQWSKWRPHWLTNSDGALLTEKQALELAGKWMTEGDDYRAVRYTP